ncbi:MAG: alpha/beta hydrolase [Gemmatimonadales bacterium]|nr:alpha/beta hydrolase [Gemmatimonadales bacterium]
MRAAVLLSGLLLLAAASCSGQSATEEITFRSGPFTLVGDLNLPQGRGPFPVVIFVHGDGPNDRTSTYPPIMDRMLRAGFATFAWDKPGTGESTGEIDRSRLQHERAQIVLDAIEVLRSRADIDPQWIGMWGISQAGYVMPRVLQRGGDVAFMIAVSCPGVPGVDQGAYLLAAQAVCAGLPEKDRTEVEHLFSAIERARTYEEYVRYKHALADYPAVASLEGLLGVNVGYIRPREDWHLDDLEGDYYWDPVTVIDTITIPVLAVFGAKDTQIDPVQGAEAYREALARGGDPRSRVELVPETDHNILLSETGCLVERERRSRAGWRNYPPAYLDLIEEWLTGLRRRR